LNSAKTPFKPFLVTNISLGILFSVNEISTISPVFILASFSEPLVFIKAFMYLLSTSLELNIFIKVSFLSTFIFFDKAPLKICSL